MIVVDASALLPVLLQSVEGRDAERRLVVESREGVFAPQVIDLEVAHALRRLTLRGRITGDRGRESLNDIETFGIIRVGHLRLIGRIWDLRNNLTAYDAAYVALAEILDVPLLTRDRRLAAAPGHHAKIELV